MIVDFPCLVSLDINPLLADGEGVIALDARIEIEPEPSRRRARIRLAIRPYPSGWAKEFSGGGTHITSGRSSRPTSRSIPTSLPGFRPMI